MKRNKKNNERSEIKQKITNFIVCTMKLCLIVLHLFNLNLFMIIKNDNTNENASSLPSKLNILRYSNLVGLIILFSHILLDFPQFQSIPIHRRI